MSSCFSRLKTSWSISLGPAPAWPGFHTGRSAPGRQPLPSGQPSKQALVLLMLSWRQAELRIRCLPCVAVTEITTKGLDGHFARLVTGITTSHTQARKTNSERSPAGGEKTSAFKFFNAKTPGQRNQDANLNQRNPNKSGWQVAQTIRVSPRPPAMVFKILAPSPLARRVESSSSFFCLLRRPRRIAFGGRLKSES